MTYFLVFPPLRRICGVEASLPRVNGQKKCKARKKKEVMRMTRVMMRYVAASLYSRKVNKHGSEVHLFHHCHASLFQVPKTKRGRKKGSKNATKSKADLQKELAQLKKNLKKSSS